MCGGIFFDLTFSQTDSAIQYCCRLPGTAVPYCYCYCPPQQHNPHQPPFLPHPFAISSVNCVQPHHMVHKHLRPYLEWFLLLLFLFLPVLPGTPVLQFLQSCHWTALSSTQPSTHTITTTSHQHQTPLLPPRPLLFYSRIILTAAYKFLVNRSRFFELNVGCISSSNFENANWYTCARPCGAWDNTCCLYCRK